MFCKATVIVDIGFLPNVDDDRGALLGRWQTFRSQQAAASVSVRPE
jgi:hypothetical protein